MAEVSHAEATEIVEDGCYVALTEKNLDITSTIDKVRSPEAGSHCSLRRYVSAAAAILSAQLSLASCRVI